VERVDFSGISMLKRTVCGAFVALIGAACGGSSIQLCGQIPEDGCPLGHGGTCDDALCAGLYDCIDGTWKEVEVCHQGQGGGASTTGASGTSSSTGCQPVMLDHSMEMLDCMPDLENPDCPAAAAEVCGPCLTGCTDFFMCEPAGWKDVAFCDEMGELILVPR
jgi:hypothetical protein